MISISILFFFRLSHYYSQFGFTTLISLSLLHQSQEMLYKFFIFLSFFFSRQTLRQRQQETFLKIFLPKYRYEAGIMRSSKTALQPKHMLEVCHSGIWCTSCFHKGEIVSVRIIQLPSNRNFSVFIWGHLSSCIHHCVHMYSYLLLELIRNFMLQDMTVELQKALITEQIPTILKATKVSPAVIVK